MYRELDDREILYMVNEQEDYIEILLEKYKPLVRKICKKYEISAKKVGFELDDLIQIANMGIVMAIDYYNPDDKASFYTYVTRCIENKLITEIKSQNTNRKKILNESISYDVILDNNKTLSDLIEDESIVNPLDYLIIEEQEIKYTNYINSLPFETAIIFELKNNGYSAKEISKILNIEEKKVFNSLRYARNKMCLN